MTIRHSQIGTETVDDIHFSHVLLPKGVGVVETLATATLHDRTIEVTRQTRLIDIIDRHREEIRIEVSLAKAWSVIDAEILRREWATVPGDDENAQLVRLAQAGRIVDLLAEEPGQPRLQRFMDALATIRTARGTRR